MNRMNLLSENIVKKSELMTREMQLLEDEPLVSDVKSESVTIFHQCTVGLFTSCLRPFISAAISSSRCKPVTQFKTQLQANDAQFKSLDISHPILICPW